MAEQLETVRRNLEDVRQRIADAAHRAGRSRDEITLVGVTKYVDPPTAALLVEAGCAHLGESRPQQLWEKAEKLSGLPICWHMVGHLQRNKVNRTVPLQPLFHGIDSYRTLASINKAAETGGITAQVLLEVNCSGDAEKHGFTPDQLPQDIEDLSLFRNVQVVGLMTMAARQGGPDVARRNFANLRELRDRYARNALEGTSLDQLSMGMSGDFEQAIEEGATIVRIGSALWTDL